MLKPQIAKKDQVVQERQEKAAKAQIGILTDFSGLSGEAMTQLRRQVKEAEGELKVAKNTLLRRAAAGESVIGPISDQFVGPNALALGYGDPLALAKLLVKFAQDKPQFFKIKAGALGGQLLTAQDVEALSKLPAREVLLAQLLGVLQGVPTVLVTVLSGVLRNLMNGAGGHQRPEGRRRRGAGGGGSSRACGRRCATRRATSARPSAALSRSCRSRISGRRRLSRSCRRRSNSPNRRPRRRGARSSVRVTWLRRRGGASACRSPIASTVTIGLIALLNMTAIYLRNTLRKRYKGSEV